MEEAVVEYVQVLGTCLEALRKTTKNVAEVVDICIQNLFR
jgi:hypothetical protein